MGIWGRFQKAGAAFFAVLMLLGQFHFCEPAYELPSGNTCAVCPELAHDDTEATEPQIAASHGDCHDCCTIEACQSEVKPVPAVVTSANLLFAAAVLPAQAEILVPIAPECEPVTWWHSGAPPTGPPSLTSARAPPRLA